MKNFNFVQKIIEDKLKSLNVDFSSVFSDNNKNIYQLKLGNDNPEIQVHRVDGYCLINMTSNKELLYSTYRIFDFEFEANTKEMKYDSLKRSTEILNIMIKGFVGFF